MCSGECPYEGCKGLLWVNHPDDLKMPCFTKITCEECNRVVWYKLSRISPEAWTEDGFNKKYEIDQATKTFKERK